MSLGICVSYFGTLLEHLCLACLSHLAYFIYVLYLCAFTCEEISHEIHFLNLLKDSFRGIVFKIYIKKPNATYLLKAYGQS